MCALDLSAWPKGHVTFLFTDVEKCTTVLDEAGHVALHELITEQSCAILALAAQFGGYEFRREGDAHKFVFHECDVDKALACAVAIQRQFGGGERRGGQEIRVRIGLHRCAKPIAPQEAVLQAPAGVNAPVMVDYEGPDIYFAARIGAIGEGAQIVISQETCRRAPAIHKSEKLSVGGVDYALHAWPDRILKGFSGAQTVYEVLLPNQAPREPGSRYFPKDYFGEKNRYVRRLAKEKDVVDYFQNRNPQSTSRLATIMAEGGMGKTRLAVSCGVRLAGEFTDGVLFVSLARDEYSADAKHRPAATAADIAAEIGVKLGLARESATPDAVLTALREKDVLLVLDNCESMKSEAVANYVMRLCSTRGVWILASSREPLGLRHAEKPVHLQNGMTQNEARELFLERAAMVWEPERAVPADEDAQITRILHLTSVAVDPDRVGPHDGCIPLAVELAAAWVDVFSCKRIADDLHQTPLRRAAMPEGEWAMDNESAFGRHQSMIRSLDWSFNLLGRLKDGPATQNAFVACGLFADDFTVAALAATLAQNADDTENQRIRLQKASLLRAREAADGARYRFHRFTREYALQKLAECPENAAYTANFVAYYVALTTKHKDINQLENHPIMDAEWRNAVAAIEKVASTKDWTGLSGLWVGLHNFLILRGLTSEREMLFKAALELATQLGDRTNQGSALNNLGLVYHSQGKWSEAEAAYEASLKIKREFGDRVGEGQTLNNLGMVYYSQGKWAEAEAAYEASLKIKREFGDRVGEGATLNNLGVVYESQGKWSEAEATYEASLKIKREFGNRVGEGLTLENLALLREKTGDVAGAVEFGRRSVEVLAGTQAVAALEKARGTLARLLEQKDPPAQRAPAGPSP